MHFDLIARVLPTKAQGGRTIGTGYPITKDLVLTARHVVLFEGRDPNVPISIEWPDLKDNTGKLCSSIVSEIIEFGEQYDIALLKCDIPPKAHNSLPYLTQQFPKAHEKWESLGYPRIGKDEGVRNKVSVLGKFHPSDNTHQIQLTSESDAIEKEGWCGISGAPVFNGNTLYAVISKTPTERKECFTAVLIPWLINNLPTFSSAIGFSEKKALPPSLSINVDHLPRPTTALIDRTTKLKQLTKTFTNPNKKLAIIVADGGIGKSALTDEWLRKIEKENYYGKEYVFGWSFYAQGTHTLFTNSQEFFNQVLTFLGISEIPTNENKKARILVQCLREKPCLLILDGLEALQHGKDGELQDTVLKEFIHCFRCAEVKSFVLISSRQAIFEVTGLNQWHQEHYQTIDLTTLSPGVGATLLKKLRVTGKRKDHLAISRDLNGHALSLVLIGHLLREHYNGDPSYAKELPPLTEAHGNSYAEKDSRHALRVLDYYDKLQDDTSRRFLQLLGLFDRPMNVTEKAVLIEKASHAEPLRALTTKQLQEVEQRLVKMGLLLDKKGTFQRMEWDTHPIIRDYFGQKFKENNPEAFKQAHGVLFDYYQGLPNNEFPDTLQEMQPLYRAVRHGCLAEKKQEALEVYLNRIRQNNEYRSWDKLGAYSQDLSALAFFSQDRKQMIVDSNLTEENQVVILDSTSYCLMALGRLEEAVELRKTEVDLSSRLKNWEFAAGAARNLVDLYLYLGLVDKAYSIAQEAIKYASFSEDVHSQIVSQSYFATVLYSKGRFDEALVNFEQAEQLDREDYLRSSLRGYRYCTLLLDRAKDKEALKSLSTQESLQSITKKSDHLISIALDYVTLARACFSLNEIDQSEQYFQLAIQSSQKAGKMNDAPLFYLYRADFYLTQNQLDLALADLNSAWDIIERCSMKLYQIDYLLIHGRYSLVTKDFDTALNHYIKAKQLIQETGYHLRDAELDLFAAKLRQDCGEEYRSTNTDLYAKTADDYLQKAKQRIADIGQWGLLRVIERDFPSSS